MFKKFPCVLLTDVTRHLLDCVISCKVLKIPFKCQVLNEQGFRDIEKCEHRDGLRNVF